MASSDLSAFENTSVSGGLTFQNLANVFEKTIFSLAYTLQFNVNEVKLYRKNYATLFAHCLFDYIHVVPFLVHRKSFLKNFLQKVSRKLINAHSY
jgi:hypothetical protein